jgi:acyl-CoA synthetase (AMP-forming)/AMP-acid ligase II
MLDSDPAGTFSTILASQARDIPDELVYVFLRDGETDEERMTYRELHERAAGFASSLAGAVTVGGRALLLLPPGLDYVAALFGCFHAGVVAVSAAPPHPKRLHRTLPRLLAIAEDAEAHCVLTTPAIKAVAEPFLSEAEQPLARAPWLTETTDGDLRLDEWGLEPRPRSELAFLQYTSGSTNTPRGVMLTHDHLVRMCSMIADAWELTGAGDLGFNWLPPYHDMGLISVMQPIVVGGASILTSPLSIMKRPMRWLEGISRYKVTTSGGPNFAYDLCVERFDPAECESLDLSSWQIAANGSEPVRASTLDSFERCFAPYGFRRNAFFPCYGLAEATLLVTGIPRSQAPVVKQLSARALERGVVSPGVGDDRAALVGCGRAYAEHDVAIVDPTTLSRCAEGIVGEIWVTGPSVTAGYWRREEETNEVFGFTIAGDSGRYLRTGDLGAIVDGELFVVGRLKDVLILNGRNIHPHDIELSAETAHDAVRTHCSAAFPIDDQLSSLFGVVVEINPSNDADTDAVMTAIRRKIADDLDLQVDLVALCVPGSVPKTTSGKIQRGLCQTLLRDGQLELAGEWRRSAS